MSTIAIVFESRYGQTKKIAQRVAELVKARGYEVRLRPVAAATGADIRASEAVVILAPVYDRKHAESITTFAVLQREALRERPTAFFSVSLASTIERRFAQQGAAKLVRDFLRETELAPRTVATFAGGLNYPAYTPAVRFAMRLACFVFRLPTDTRGGHELTDFAQVERATNSFLDAVESRARAQQGALGRLSDGEPPR